MAGGMPPPIDDPPPLGVDDTGALPPLQLPPDAPPLEAPGAPVAPGAPASTSGVGVGGAIGAADGCIAGPAFASPCAIWFSGLAGGCIPVDGPPGGCVGLAIFVGSILPKPLSGFPAPSVGELPNPLGALGPPPAPPEAPPPPPVTPPAPPRPLGPCVGGPLRPTSIGGAPFTAGTSVLIGGWLFGRIELVPGTSVAAVAEVLLV